MPVTSQVTRTTAGSREGARLITGAIGRVATRLLIPRLSGLKYAIYADGPVWHLTCEAWRRDRQRGELRGLGRTTTVSCAAGVVANSADCLAKIGHTLDAICNKLL